MFENPNSSKIMRETVSMTNKGPQMYEYFEAFSWAFSFKRAVKM